METGSAGIPLSPRRDNYRIDTRLPHSGDGYVALVHRAETDATNLNGANIDGA